MARRKKNKNTSVLKIEIIALICFVALVTTIFSLGYIGEGINAFIYNLFGIMTYPLLIAILLYNILIIGRGKFVTLNLKT